jgi:hypothetical protein
MVRRFRGPRRLDGKPDAAANLTMDVALICDVIGVVDTVHFSACE